MQMVLLSTTKVDHLANGSATSQHAAALLDGDIPGEHRVKQGSLADTESIVGWDDKPGNQLMKNLIP